MRKCKRGNGKAQKAEARPAEEAQRRPAHTPVLEEGGRKCFQPLCKRQGSRLPHAVPTARNRFARTK